MTIKNKILLIIGIILILIGVYVFCEKGSPSFDPFNTTYLINGTPATLVNGRLSEEVVPGSASTIEVAILGDPVKGDLNGDKKDDAALFLTFSGGGSGTFYYAVAALQNEETIGTNAILLGDRIITEDISIENGIITVNYKDRNVGEPFAVEPSVEVKRTFIVQDGALQENTVFTIEEPTYCTEDQRNVDACIEIYAPVCAKVNVECITTPCDPVYETYPNDCFACQNPLVESYTEGECPVE